MTDTAYNGSIDCKDCGTLVSPLEVLFAFGEKVCPECRNKKATKRVKNGMARKTKINSLIFVRLAVKS